MKEFNVLESSINYTTKFTMENIEKMTYKVRDLKILEEKIERGGGEKNIEKQHKKGRLTARERIHILIDENSDFFELGKFAAHNMYMEYGGAPSAGTVTGIGIIEGRQAMIIANDATVKAGAFFPMTAKKIIRAQHIAMENEIPTIYLVDSAGVFLPMQDEIFPDQDDFGRIFRNNAVMSTKGIPQITAIMGSCVAGGAYLPVMTDKTIMVDGAGLYLAGPQLVESAIGQKVSSEELGGTKVHMEINGTIDYREKNDQDAIKRIRSLVNKFGKQTGEIFSKEENFSKPKYAAKELYGLQASSPEQSYDIHDVIARLVDDSKFDEYKKDYGKTIVCGYARIGGVAVGIVANQKTIVKNAAGRSQFGGVIYTDSSEKAARFILDCNQSKVPIIFFHDVNGFMVGKESEHEGIIKAGAKMVNAVSNSVVPKLVVILGGSFGAGHYAMCGKAYDPNFIVAWPNAKYSVMSGASAAKTLVGLEISKLKKKGKEPNDDEVKKIYDEIKTRYDAQMDIKYGASRLWVDAIIDPIKTRDWLIMMLEAARHKKKLNDFSVGVFQS
jgi:acetyl-CoA carboxylase carboxyltransferase component